MAGCRERVTRAFAHQEPDRTPLYEIFQSYHPIFWDICGHTIATDEAMCWDALADGVSWEELTELDAQASFAINRHFELDIVHIPAPRPRDLPHPTKLGPYRWHLDGATYVRHERTKMVVLEDPSQAYADSAKISEEERRGEIESWDGSIKQYDPEPPLVVRRFMELAAAAGTDWVYMGEIGAGTGVAFYPPFQLMWLATEPDMLRRWLEMVKAQAFHETRKEMSWGCQIITMGGDVSCDKGPFLSPAHYREFILPVIQEHVAHIHKGGALAVYTSDGNHWPIKDEFFLRSGTDGYAEVDKAAGMTMERLIDEGIKERVCVLGNIDARHTLCLGTPEQVRAEVLECLELGRRTPGGHILHASHSVHEDVRAENYVAMVDAYREFFGLPHLPR
jgi:hypothetical protein